MKQQDLLISVIIAIRNEASRLEAYLADIHRVLEASYDQYEVIVVDDGSTDLGGTASPDPAGERIAALVNRYPGTRLLHLSSAFGTEAAFTAGIDSAIGDYCVTLVPAIDPPELIPRFVEEARRSGAIVFGQRETPERDGGALFQLGRRCFHWLCDRGLGLKIPKNTTFFMAMNRNAVTQLMKANHKVRFLRAITSYIGLPAVTIPYEYRVGDRDRRAYGKGLWEALVLSVNIIGMNSLRPLRIASLACALAAGGSFLTACAALLALAVRWPEPALGAPWPNSLFALALAVGFGLACALIFFSLAVILEYLVWLSQEVRGKPIYFVSKERASASGVRNEARLNVLRDAAP